MRVVDHARLSIGLETRLAIARIDAAEQIQISEECRAEAFVLHVRMRDFYRLPIEEVDPQPEIRD